MRLVGLTILLLLTYLSKPSAFAADYYVYHPIEHYVSGSAVYTSDELLTLKSFGINYQVTKVSSELDLFEIQKKYPSLKVEPVQSIEFYQYRSFQWYLNNNGGMITRRITDIDTVQIQAKVGEDIRNIKDNSEQNEKIKVAVIDSGVDISHPELSSFISRKESECRLLEAYKACLSDRERDNDQCHADFANQDSDGDGYPLDCHGWSVTNNSYPGVSVTGNPEMRDQVGHGTHIAGLIAAQKNQMGIDGVADNVQIIPVQVAMNSAVDNPIDNIAKGVLYALKNNAKVINLSLGWRFQFETKLMRDMIKLATDNGVAVVVAAGNDAHSDISYPCAYDDVICVGAHDQTGKLASFSNRGTSVDVVAPGVDILSTWPTNIRSRLFTQDYNYEYMSGTSQAAPLVTGLVAKLMSRGFSSNQAKIKLFKGAREKIQNSDIRFGNIDYQRALQAPATDFLYPAHKEAALILHKNISENKVRIKIKNLGETQENVSIKLFSQSQDIQVLTSEKTVSSITQNETVEFDFDLNISSYRESEHRFRLKIKEQEYVIRANIVRVISPDLAASDDFSNQSAVIINKIIGDLSSSTILRAFDQISENKENPDFLAVTNENNQTSLAVLAFKQDQYILGQKFNIRDANPVFLNFSQVDIDLDGNSDYVVTYVVTDREGNKTSKFIAFNSDLTPKRIFIAPNNQYDNKKTFLPGKFKWLRKNNRMVPYWIGFGENGTERELSPWEPVQNPTSNYVYFLDPELGLQNEALEDDIIPLHFLYQSEEELRSGEAYFFASSSVGFFKEYLLYQLKDGKLVRGEVVLDDFFDIFEPRPLPLLSPLETQSSHGFFNESSNGGSQIILKTYLLNNELSSELIRLPNIFTDENIKFVKSVGENAIFYQTEHKIAVYDRQTQQHFSRESKVSATRRRLQPLAHFSGLYLPAREAPSFTGEVFQYLPSKGIVSLAAYRTLTVGGCESIGKVKANTRESLAFHCSEAKKIIFLPLDL